MSPLRRTIVLLLWLCVGVAYVAAILPAREAPAIWGWDKANHMTAFLVVTVLARLAYPNTGWVKLFLIIAAFGGFIELCQALPFIHRDAEWDDWFADIVAILIGFVVAYPLAILAERRRQRRLAEQAALPPA